MLLEVENGPSESAGLRALSFEGVAAEASIARGAIEIRGAPEALLALLF